MVKKIKSDLKREIELLAEEIKRIGPFMRGSITIMGKKNKQPYFSVGINGKTKMMYLGDKRAKIALKYTKNYKRMLEIVDRMTIINMSLLKSVKTK